MAEENKSAAPADTTMSRVMSAAEESEQAIQIALLKEENKALRDRVASLEKMLDEKAEADKAAKAAAKSGKSGPIKLVPIALTSILGKGRRLVEPGQQLDAEDVPGLEEGVHYQLVQSN